jgi:hypothetical protein
MARRKKKKNTEGMPPRQPNGMPIGMRVRPTSRRTGFQKLRGISCFSEVHERITKGWPISDLARWVQDDMQEYTDAERSTLVTVLTKYRESLPPAERAKHTLPKSHIEAVQEVDELVNELRQYSITIRDQVSRYKKQMAIEEKVGTLMPGLGQEIRIVGELLKQSASLKMDLGLNERHLGTVDVEGNLLSGAADRYAGTEVEKVISDPKSRARLNGIAEHLMSLADRGIALERNEDGDFKLVDETATEPPSDQ